MNIFNKLRKIIDYTENKAKTFKNKMNGTKCICCKSFDVDLKFAGFGIDESSAEYHCNSCLKDFTIKTKFEIKDNKK